MNDIKIGETARMLDVTSATVRNWLKEFGKYLSPTANNHRRKRFTPSDIATLKKIKALLDEGLTYAEVPDNLDVAEYADVLEPEAFKDWTPQAEQPQVNAIATIEVFEFITQSLNAQAEQHQREIAAKDETIKLLREELERARLPWWKKLF